MSYLIDTDWIVDYLKGRPAATRLLRDVLAPDGVAISLVTFAEIEEGIAYGSAPRRREDDFLAMLGWVDLMGLDEQIMRQFARIRADLRHARQVIGDFDTLIAATAIHHDLTLVTRNFRHYDRIPTLKLYSDPT